MSVEHVGGLHSVRALLRTSSGSVERLHVQEGRRDARMRSLQDLAASRSIQTHKATRAELDQLVPGLEHQGVVAVVQSGSDLGKGDLMTWLQRAESPQLVLVLDEVQDPHNLGACLRSADAAGVHAVVIPSANSVGITPVVRKVASGAAESVALFRVGNLQRCLGELQAAGLWVYGAAGEASRSLYELDLTNSVVIVMGAEGRGLRRLTRERCDELFHLPMQGTVSSLNVSVATGVTLFEVARQRARLDCSAGRTPV